MKIFFFGLFFLLLSAVFFSSSGLIVKPVTVISSTTTVRDKWEKTARATDIPVEYNVMANIVKIFQNRSPKEWGEYVTGVRTRLDTNEKVLALTFDACGGSGGNGYDKDLIDYLIKESVPATLFINSRWIDQNNGIFISLAENSLFEIENHGTEHKPLSVNGKSAYGIEGTKSVKNAIEEVKTNEDKIYKLTGKKPSYYRSGTNYYDDVAIEILGELREEAVGYSVLGDAGATFSASQIKAACIGVQSGSIIIFHMNHPEKDTAEGIRVIVPLLRANGFQFVKLEDYPLK